MKQMLTLTLPPEEATLAKVRERLGLKSNQIDADFGVVNIDPKKNLYTVLVDEGVAESLGGSANVQGPFSNPRIESFGPPKKSKK